MTRIRFAWRLARQSLTLLRRDRSLAAFPMLGFAAGAVAVAVVMAPGVVLAAATGREWLLAPFAAAAAYAATFTAIHFGVALAAAADRSLDGHDTTVAEGLAAARARRGVIARWAAVALCVGLLISAVQALLSESPLGRAAGAVFGGVANLAWGVATFFVVPLLAQEGLEPKDAVKRSSAVVKERWGEGVAGAASIGVAVAVVAFVPIAVLAAIAAASFDASVVAGGVLVAVAVLVALAAGAIGMALNTIFRVALLRYASSGELPAGFTAGDLDGAFRRRRRAIRAIA
jgi:Family of unknown function (DUF6159)